MSKLTNIFWTLDLDDIFDGLWGKMEESQDGLAAHRISFMAETKKEAAEILAKRLMPFFEREMYKSNNCGDRIT